MASTKKLRYAPGQHPNSQANLIYHAGRPKAFGAEKKKRYLSVTDEGWNGAIEAVKASGCNSVSEYLEKLGRGEIVSTPIAELLHPDQDGDRGVA